MFRRRRNILDGFVEPGLCLVSTGTTFEFSDLRESLLAIMEIHQFTLALSFWNSYDLAPMMLAVGTEKHFPYCNISREFIHPQYGLSL